jgi:hypothetical protein
MGSWRGIKGWCLAVALTAVVLTAAHAQPAAPQAAAGTTLETAIVLPGIADEFHGVVAEHAYIAAHFPTWHIEYQTRITQNDRNYDLLGMLKPDRTKVTIFFDITEWIGQ